MRNNRIDDAQTPSDQSKSKPDEDEAGHRVQEYNAPPAPRRENELQPPPPDGNEHKAREKRRHTRDPAMFWLGVVTLLVIFLYALYARQQAIDMRKAAEATEKAVKVAEKAREDGEKPGADILKEMGKQSRAMQSYANAAASQAESSRRITQTTGKALEAAIAASHIDERPWVGVVDVSTEGGNETHDVFTVKGVRVAVHNSGKTPALKMSDVRHIFLFRSWNEPIPDYDSESRAMEERTKAAKQQGRDAILKRHPELAGQMAAWEKEHEDMAASIQKRVSPEGGVLPPGVVSTFVVPNFGDWPTRTKDRRPMTHYILGKFTYHDIFGGPEHTTKFCLMHARGTSFTFCPENSWMD